MSRRPRSRQGRGAALRLALACAALLSLALPGVAAAAIGIDFGKVSASQRFLVSIDVEEPVTLPAGVTLVEALVRTSADAPTFVATLPTPAAGATTLRYSFKTPAGGLSPNSPVVLGFRVSLANGLVEEGPTTTLLYQDTRYQWKTLSGSLVRVHWTDGDDAFGRRALQIGEDGVKRAADLLGVAETAPIDFYIYADRGAFYDVIGPGGQENIGGLALPQIRTLFANIGPDEVNSSWVSTVVPHELTHVVFDSATKNDYHQPPHWLNEGLAVYLSEGYGADAKASVRNAIRSGELMPLTALVGSFPTTADRFSLAYDEAVSAIDYLIRAHGQDALVKLIRRYADGVSDDTAFSDALGVDTAGFEGAWLKDLGTTEPAPFGPKPAPAGPVPPGWGGSSGNPAPGTSQVPGATVGPVATAAPTTGDTAGATMVAVLGGVVVIVVVLIAIAYLGRRRPVQP